MHLDSKFLSFNCMCGIFFCFKILEVCQGITLYIISYVLTFFVVADFTLIDDFFVSEFIHLNTFSENLGHLLCVNIILCHIF